MRHLGLVKYFNSDKGYGVIGTPDIGDVYIHKLYFKNKSLVIYKGAALIFSTEMKKDKNLAIDISNLTDFNDFSFSMEYLTKPRFVSIDGNYDVVHESLIQLYNNNTSDLFKYFIQYFDVKYNNKNNVDFLKFLALYRKIITDGNISFSHQEIYEQISYFIKNLSDDLLFQIWKEKLYKVDHIFTMNRMDSQGEELYIEFPRRIFINSYLKIDLEDLHRLSSKPDGSQIIYEILLKKVEGLNSVNKIEINRTIEAFKFIKDNDDIYYLRKRLSDKLLEIIAQFDYLMEGNVDDLNFILQIIKVHIGSHDYERVIQSFNAGINNENIFLLWQKTRYFDPDTDFFKKNLTRLTYNDFLNGNEAFHREYFHDKFNDLGEIIDKTAFGLLICLIVELPVKVIHKVLEQLPLTFQVAICLNFPRAESFNGKYYEASYEKPDVPLSTNTFINYFEQLESIDEILSSSWLVEAIQDAYSIKTQRYGKMVGFRNIDLQERKQLIEEVFSQKKEIASNFLAKGFKWIDESNAVLMVKSIIPKFINENSITLKELTYLFQRSEISDKTRRSLFNYISQLTSRNNRVLLWFHEHTSNFHLTEIIEEFNTFSMVEQVKLLRKTFALLHNQELTSVAEFLELLLTLLNKENININVRICLKVIESLTMKQEYIGENVISEIIYMYVGEEVKKIIQIDDFFEECRGRTWMTEGEDQRSWYLQIKGKDFPVSDDKVEIGEIHYPFDKESKCVSIGGTTYKYKWTVEDHNIFRKLYDKPVGVTFCDAVKSEYDEKLKRHFYWCCNGKCYAPCQNDHINLEWNNYSLRDFIKILKLPFVEDKYYRFVSVVNRANRILKKLQCSSCKKLLRDAKTSEFAFYRVTTFHCTNPECDEYHKVIYLNHCLNWKCLNVVDSRISKTCPNGWYICDSCHNCCSQEKIESRYENLITNNAFNLSNPRHQKLKYQVDNKLGHLEKGEIFNYRTGEKGCATLPQQEPLIEKALSDNDGLPF